MAAPARTSVRHGHRTGHTDPEVRKRGGVTPYIFFRATMRRRFLTPRPVLRLGPSEGGLGRVHTPMHMCTHTDGSVRACLDEVPALHKS